MQPKKVISTTYASCTSSWKPWGWVRLDLILTIRHIYIDSNLNLFTKFTSSSGSTQFKGILPWNISQMITKTVPISTTIVISYSMKRGLPFWVWRSQWKLSQQHDPGLQELEILVHVFSFFLGTRVCVHVRAPQIVVRGCVEANVHLLQR